ncbi:hypothetical protein [Georgenia faecalis]|uniref:hypothetical protein n=1 Tax=Georgenia faecalis TaxID=2483799 RepID=UPI000FD8CAD4|nr:hypothetical protein [Georgenia faecalis]
MAAHEEGERAFATWDAAVAAVRGQLGTQNGQWFIDALEWPVLRDGSLHREGPVPPADIIAQVLERLGEGQPPTALLDQVVAADDALLSVAARRRAGTGERERFWANVRHRSQAPELSLLRTLPEDPAHRYVRDELEPVSRALDAVGVQLATAHALASPRWWPGRAATLRRELARLTDPMSLAGIYRTLMEVRRPPGRAWYDALGRATELERGEGVPPFDPVDWILSALRYRIDVTDDLAPSR